MYGKEYTSNSVSLSIGGVQITRALQVSWKAEIETDELYGMSREPFGLSDGNKKYSGNFKMHQSQIEKLLNATGNIDLDGLDGLDAQVTLSEYGRFSQRTLVNVRCTAIGEDYKSGDKFAEIDVPFKFTRILT
jgi:hypothetical protein